MAEKAFDFFPEARWPRCIVHFYRNVFSHVPSQKQRQVALMLKAIHAQESRRTAEEKAASVIAALADQRLRKAAKILCAGVGETLTYYGFPDVPIRLRQVARPLVADHRSAAYR